MWYAVFVEICVLYHKRRQIPLDIKVVAIDLDGTLLNKQNAVTPENVEAIRLAKEKGIEVVPSTGRLLCESRFALEAIGGCNYSLHCNGSIIWDHRADCAFFKRFFKIALFEVFSFTDKNIVFCSLCAIVAYRVYNCICVHFS